MTISHQQFVLDALAYRIRILSRPQYLSGGTGSASELRRRRRQLAKLERSKLTRQVTILARPTPIIDRPLYVWRPGDAAPDAGCDCAKRALRFANATSIPSVGTSPSTLTCPSATPPPSFTRLDR